MEDCSYGVNVSRYPAGVIVLIRLTESGGQVLRNTLLPEEMPTFMTV